MRCHPSNLLTCSVILFLSACGAEIQEADHHFEIATENGVSVAMNTGGPRHEADLFSYQLVVELQEDEREESFLARPSDFHMDERGWFYVPEHGDCRIAVFDSTGRYSHSIGREGSGPGELRQNFYIVDLSDGIVTVSNPYLNRITRFTTEGELIEVLQATRPSVFVNLTYSVGEDRFLSLGTEQTSPGSRVIRMRPFAFLHDAKGDTVASVSTPWFDFGAYDRTDNVTYPVVFQPSASFAFQGGFGFFVTTGESPSIDVHDVSGQVVRRIDLGLEQVRTTAGDRVRLREYFNEEMSVEGVNERRIKSLAARRDRGRISEYRPFWRAAQIDDAGFIWLEVMEHPLDAKNAQNHSLWRVVSPKGEYIGLTRRPPNSGQVMKGHLLTMYLDMKARAIRLRVYRIIPAVNGLVYP